MEKMEEKLQRLAPVLTVNDKVYPAMTPDAAAELIRELRGA